MLQHVLSRSLACMLLHTLAFMVPGLFSSVVHVPASTFISHMQSHGHESHSKPAMCPNLTVAKWSQIKRRGAAEQTLLCTPTLNPQGI